MKKFHSNYIEQRKDDNMNSNVKVGIHANLCDELHIERRLTRPVNVNALADSDALPSKNRKEYMKYE